MQSRYYRNPPFSVSIVACYYSTFSKFVYIASVWLMLLNERGHRSCPYLFTLTLPVSSKQRAQLKRKMIKRDTPTGLPCFFHLSCTALSSTACRTGLRDIATVSSEISSLQSPQGIRISHYLTEPVFKH